MEKIPNTKKEQQKTWNFWATLFFIVCLIGLGFVLEKKGIGMEDFTVGNITLMVLATYRLTRILVSSKSMVSKRAWWAFSSARICWSVKLGPR